MVESSKEVRNLGIRELAEYLPPELRKLLPQKMDTPECHAWKTEHKDCEGCESFFECKNFLLRLNITRALTQFLKEVAKEDEK